MAREVASRARGVMGGRIGTLRGRGVGVGGGGVCRRRASGGGKLRSGRGVWSGGEVGEGGWGGCGEEVGVGDVQCEGKMEWGAASGRGESFSEKSPRRGAPGAFH